MKYLIYPLIVFQFAIGFKSYSEVIKKNNNTKNWEPIKKNSNNNSVRNLNWEIIEKNNQDYFRENLEWKIFPKEEKWWDNDFSNKEVSLMFIQFWVLIPAVVF